MEREEQHKKKEKEKRHRELGMAAGSSRPIEMESYYDPDDQKEDLSAYVSEKKSDQKAVGLSSAAPSTGAGLSEAVSSILFGVAAIYASSAGYVLGSLLRSWIRPRVKVRKPQPVPRVNEQQILRAYRVFEGETGIVVSEGAHVIVMDTLKSIINDPHPNWRISPGELQNVVDHFTANLPEYLSALARDERVSRHISSFDVLHWLTRNLASLCIIDKPQR